MTGRKLWAAIAASVIAITAAALNSVNATAQHARWGADYFPNVTLTTQDGVEVKFYDDLIKGKIVAIDLIYTTCQYACPLETARLAQVQRILGDRMGREIFFYSITIDPEHDTPKVLKEYAEKYNAGPGWLFLTGKASDIELISKKLGLYTEPDPSNPDGHTPSLLVGNEKTGQWMRNSALDNPRFLARTIGDWLNSWKTTSTELKSFAEVPMLNFDQGQYTFKNHCAACHTIGGGDAIGPDLKGVTLARDRRWLTRMIVEPEKVFAEGDPTALALREKYRGVLMPSLSLGTEDASLLIDFIAKQSGIATGTGSTNAAKPANAADAGAAQHGAHPGNVEASKTSAAPRAAALDVTPVVDAYLKIQQALSDDTIDGVAESARILATETVKIGSRVAPIRSAINAFAQVGDLTAARDAFGPLSDAVIRVAKDQNASLGDEVKVAYCPMARRYWLQKADKIRNPFYGRAMLECGRFVDELPALTK